MSLGETRKLLQQSRKIVDEADDNTNISVLLNTILKLVSSIDVRLQGVEKSVGKFDEIKTIITSLNSRVVSVEKNIINCQAKITDVENSVQGVGNLFDNLKSDCDKNKSEIIKVGKQFGSLKPYCDKNKSEIAKVSDQLEALANQESSNNQCNCRGHMENLQNSILDLQCRSMKNNLIFTGLYEVRDENTEELLRHFLYKEIGIDFRIDFGNVHRFSHKPRGKRPIVARFIHYNDLQYVLNNAYRLRNTPYGIRQQFPREIEDRRRELYPIQKEAKRLGKRVALIRDRLYIDNELYVHAEDMDGIGDFDTPSQPNNVWSTPRNSGDRRPPKRQRVSSTTPERG